MKNILVFCLGPILYFGIPNVLARGKQHPLPQKERTQNVAILPTAFVTDFEQTHTSVLNGKIKKSNGIIKYKYPGMIYLEMLSPEPGLFIANKDMSWYYTPPFDANEKGEVIIHPHGHNALVKIFDSLKNGLKSNELYSVQEIKSGFHLKFKDKAQKELGVEQVLLNFDGSNFKDLSHLTQMILTYTDQKDVKLTFQHFKNDVSLTDQTFHFQVPENTHVVSGR